MRELPDKTLTELEDEDGYHPDEYRDDEEIEQMMDSTMKAWAVVYAAHWLLLRDDITLREYDEMIDDVEDEFGDNTIF